MDASKKPIAVYFLCEESYSLFSGDISSSRFGGAGLQMYFLGEEIAKDPRFSVTFLFQEHDIAQLRHDRISFEPIRGHANKCAALVSRLSRRFLKERAIKHDRSDKVLIATMAYCARSGLEQAHAIGAKTIFRVASDNDVNNSPVFPGGQLPTARLDDISSCDKVVVQSEKQRDLLRESRMKESTVIPSGIPAKYSLEDKSNISKDTVLWVSNSSAIKQPWIFTALAKHFPQEKFVMIMPDVSSDISYAVRILADELDNIELINEQIPYAISMEHFNRAKLFVNTSLREGFPNTFLQAWMTKTPTISWLVDPDDILTRNRLGLACGGDDELFFQNFARLVDNTELREIMGRNALKYAHENHSIQMSAAYYKELILSMISSEGQEC